jgi:hypothetical protein
MGPIRELPELSELERIEIRKKIDTTIVELEPPTTWKAMFELWLKQGNGKDLTSDEVTILAHFDNLPVPYGLLKEHERKDSFIDKLDHLWRAITVATTGAKETLLRKDFERYTLSQSVSTIYQKERMFQQYELFELWSSLILPCISNDYQQDTELDAGVQLFSYIVGSWARCNNGDDKFYIDLIPERNEIIQIRESFERGVKTLRENDADVDAWVNSKEFNSLFLDVDYEGSELEMNENGSESDSGDIESEESDEGYCDDEFDELDDDVDDFIKMYAKITRRGFRQLFGMKNVSVKVHKNGSVRVKFLEFKRLIMLACVRRINLECRMVAGFNKVMFSVISNFRECFTLVGLIPSDDELAMACGIDL